MATVKGDREPWEGGRLVWGLEGTSWFGKGERNRTGQEGVWEGERRARLAFLNASTHAGRGSAVLISVVLHSAGSEETQGHNSYSEVKETLQLDLLLIKRQEVYESLCIHRYCKLNLNVSGFKPISDPALPPGPTVTTPSSPRCDSIPLNLEEHGSLPQEPCVRK
jgi:hypothetical protein